MRSTFSHDRLKDSSDFVTEVKFARIKSLVLDIEASRVNFSAKQYIESEFEEFQFRCRVLAARSFRCGSINKSASAIRSCALSSAEI